MGTKTNKPVMRLLHSTTLDFKVFHDDKLPPYAILSHTWEEEEIGYQEMRFLQKLRALPDNLKNNTAFIATMEAAFGLDSFIVDQKPVIERRGYRKILKTAEIAREKKLNYIWVDTCCIDKSSSAELQEAINSMYEWYRKSTYCAVYLEDVAPDCNRVAPSAQDSHIYFDSFESMLRKSRWITRGWTLQELIAPAEVVFYDQKWRYITQKSHAIHCIHRVTGIQDYVLITGDLSKSSVAQKMSWAAKRSTTRKEDRAYSLMGIFEVHIPMLYGEGDRAFRRLQEEIIRTTPDDSIFAWRTSGGSLSAYVGLLAHSPQDFEHSQNITQGKGSFSISNLGLRIETNLKPVRRMDIQGGWDDSLYMCTLDAENREGEKVALILRKLEPLKYARVQAHSFGNWRVVSDDVVTLYIEHTPKIPQHFKSRMMYCFKFQRSSGETYAPPYRIYKAQPKEFWNPVLNELVIPGPDVLMVDTPTSSSLEAVTSESNKNFLGVISLIPVLPSFELELVKFHILLGYDAFTGLVWCKIVTGKSSPCLESEVIKQFRDSPSYEMRHRLVLNNLWGKVNDESEINVNISPGLCRGMVSHVVEIDGLMNK